MSKDEMQQKIFTSNLNYYIQARDDTQKDIADKIGVSPQTFNTWCQGIAIPRMGKIQALADYFGIKKSDLIEDRKDQACSTSPPLTQPENRLLDNYRQLNPEGRERLLEDSEMYVASGRYIKDCKFDVV